jgi:hypothetical protein
MATPIDYGQIRDSLKEITKQSIPYSRICLVNTVDEANFVCDVSPIDNLDVELYDIRLSGNKTPTSVQIPTIGTEVIVSFLDETNGYISMFSQIDKIWIANNDENLKAILTDYIEGLHDSLMAATFKHPQGPTLPEPINKIQFEQARDAALESIENLLGGE